MAELIAGVEIDYFYPDREEVLIAYARVVGVQVSACLDYVRDMNLLESALARPQNASAYEGASLMRQAATLLWGLVRNHPFYDGNKRMGWAVTQAFLRGNGVSIVDDTESKFDMIKRIAEGQAEVDEVETWINQRIDPWPSPQ